MKYMCINHIKLKGESSYKWEGSNQERLLGGLRGAPRAGSL